MCLPSLLYHQLLQLVYSKQGTPSTHLPRPAARNVLDPGGRSGGATLLRAREAGGGVASPALFQPGPDRCGALPHSGEGFPARTPARRKALSEVELSLGLAVGKGSGEPRSSGESRACSCAAEHGELAPAAWRAPEQPVAGKAGRAHGPRTPCPAAGLAPGRRRHLPASYRSTPPAEGPLRRGWPPPLALPQAMTPAPPRSRPSETHFHLQAFPSSVGKKNKEETAPAPQ